MRTCKNYQDHTQHTQAYMLTPTLAHPSRLLHIPAHAIVWFFIYFNLEFLAFSKLPLLTQFSTTLRVVLQGTDWLSLLPLIPLLGGTKAVNIRDGLNLVVESQTIYMIQSKLQPHRRTSQNLLRWENNRNIRKYERSNTSTN